MRPEGWKRYIEVRDEKKRYTSKDLNEAHEAGAAAYEKGLKKDGTKFKKGRWTDDATFETEVPGWVVFIEE